jgi:subtilase family serine protease
MRQRHATAAALAAALVISSMPGFAQARKPDRNGPVMAVNPPIPHDLLPDLLITSANATATCTPDGKVKATIQAVVKNQSSKGVANLSRATWQIALGLTNIWSTSSGDESQLEFKLSAVVLPKVSGPAQLPPGATWTGTLDVVGMPKYKAGRPKPGQYGFALVVDPQGAVGEANEKNNELLTFAFDPCFKG